MFDKMLRNCAWKVSHAVAVGLLCIGFSAGAKADYPEEPVEFIVPFGPGGAFDTLARTLAEPLSEELGVPVVVRNVPGGGGLRGTVELFRSAPDGYTIGFPHFVALMTEELLRGNEPPADYREFEILQMVALAKHFVFVRNESAIQSIQDVAELDETPRVATTGPASTAWTHIMVLANPEALDFEVDWVHGYDNLLEAAAGVVRGDAPVGVGGLHQLSGMMDEIRPIVYFHTERHSAFPDAPTVAELGFPQYSALASPYIVSAPPETPEDRLAVLRSALETVVQSDAIRDWVETGGFVLAEDEDPHEMLRDAEEVYSSIAELLDEADQ